MRCFDDVAALRAAVGTHLGFSGWHVVTQAEIDLFGEATGDDRLRRHGQGIVAAPGWLALSIGTMLIAEVIEVRGTTLSLNYGVNRVRFPAAAQRGARLRAGVEVVSAEEGPEGCRVTYRVAVELEASKQPACLAETIALYRWTDASPEPAR